MLTVQTVGTIAPNKIFDCQIVTASETHVGGLEPLICKLSEKNDEEICRHVRQYKERSPQKWDKLTRDVYTRHRVPSLLAASHAEEESLLSIIQQLATGCDGQEVDLNI
jgi:hypothetical protein